MLKCSLRAEPIESGRASRHVGTLQNLAEFVKTFEERGSVVECPDVSGCSAAFEQATINRIHESTSAAAFGNTPVRRLHRNAN